MDVHAERERDREQAPLRQPDEPARTAEQEVASGQSEDTPARALGAVLVTVAALAAAVVALAALAYWLA